MFTYNNAYIIKIVNLLYQTKSEKYYDKNIVHKIFHLNIFSTVILKIFSETSNYNIEEKRKNK